MKVYLCLVHNRDVDVIPGPLEFILVNVRGPSLDIWGYLCIFQFVHYTVTTLLIVTRTFRVIRYNAR